MNMTPTAEITSTQERRDLLDALHQHRELFKVTLIGLSDEVAASRPTVSALSLGGLVKHVAEVEAGRTRFAAEGPAALGDGSWADIDWDSVGADGSGIPDDVVAAWEAGFSMQPGETLADIVAHYDEVAAATDRLVATIDLDTTHELPPAPWFEAGARWSARRAFIHIAAETAQHAGHADIIRESIDGAKTMG